MQNDLVISAYPQGSLWLRALDSQDWRQIEGVTGARYPFWSPDSTWIAFFEDERLRKIPAGGGPAQTIARAADGRGGTWGKDGTILFAASVYDQIQSVPEAGGEPQSITKPLEGSAPSRRFPHLLPDGRPQESWLIAPCRARTARNVWCGWIGPVRRSISPPSFQPTCSRRASHRTAYA